MKRTPAAAVLICILLHHHFDHIFYETPCMSTRAGYLLAFLVLTTLHGRSADLLIRGAVKTPLRLSLADIKSFPQSKASAKEHSGNTATYEGVTLAELLHRAGVPQGEALRGDALRLCVLIKAADGYVAAFALAELDPELTLKQVLLAFQRDGADLDSTAGPLRLVIPDEKRQVRWVRQVNEIEVVRVGGKGIAETRKKL